MVKNASCYTFNLSLSLCAVVTVSRSQFLRYSSLFYCFCYLCLLSTMTLWCFLSLYPPVSSPAPFICQLRPFFPVPCSLSGHLIATMLSAFGAQPSLTVSPSSLYLPPSPSFLSHLFHGICVVSLLENQFFFPPESSWTANLSLPPSLPQSVLFSILSSLSPPGFLISPSPESDSSSMTDMLSGFSRTRTRVWLRYCPSGLRWQL